MRRNYRVVVNMTSEITGEIAAQIELGVSQAPCVSAAITAAVYVVDHAADEMGLEDVSISSLSIFPLLDSEPVPDFSLN